MNHQFMHRAEIIYPQLNWGINNAYSTTIKNRDCLFGQSL